MTQYDLGQVVGADGSDGEDGVGITSISKTSTSGKVDTYTITYTDSSTSTFTVTNGNDGAKGDKGDKGDNGTNGTDGEDGKGISSITKTSTSGLVDTYTITYTDSTTTTFTVTNGSDATVTVDSAMSSSSTNPVQNKVIKTAIDGKADSTHAHGNLQSDGSVGTSSNASKNVVTDSNGKITTEAKPTIPSASSSTPSADTTSGSVGDASAFARANHTHPKSSIYAEATHTHSQYVNPTIADNLTTDDATQVLSAKQGKVLADLIGDAITYINQ